MDTKTRLLSLTFAFILTLTACNKPQDALDPALASPTQTSAPAPTETALPSAAAVNGAIIPLETFNAELLRFQDAQSALGKTVPLAEAETRVLNNLIDQTLLAQAAHNAGYTLAESELNARLAALTEDLGGEEALSVWLSTHHYTRESFRQALRNSIEAAWMRDTILSQLPSTAEQVHAKQILLYNREKAEKVRTELNNGADFNKLAAQYDPKTGGELGWFPRGYLLEPEIEKTAFALDIGVPSQIIETEVGFHIIMVLEREAERPLAPDALLALQEAALKNWLQKAYETSKIENKNLTNNVEKNVLE